MSIKSFLIILSITAYSLPAIAQQAAAFRDDSNSIYLYGLKPSEVVDTKIETREGKLLNRRVRANSCGYAIIRNAVGTTIFLPTAQGAKAEFIIANIPQQKPLACVRGNLYLPIDFNPNNAVATAIDSDKPDIPQPIIVRNNENLIINNIPPGTYTVTNAVTQQSKVYAVTDKGCLVSNRSDIGNATKFLISRQGLTFPIDWDAVISVDAVPSC